MPGGVNRSMFELGHTSTYKKIQTTLVTYKNITKVWWILYGFRQYITKSSKGKIIIIKTKSCKKEQKKNFLYFQYTIHAIQCKNTLYTLNRNMLDPGHAVNRNYKKFRQEYCKVLANIVWFQARHHYSHI